MTDRLRELVAEMPDATRDVVRLSLEYTYFRHDFCYLAERERFASDYDSERCGRIAKARRSALAELLTILQEFAWAKDVSL